MGLDWLVSGEIIFFYIDEVLFLGMVVWMFVNNFILLLLCNLVNNRVIFGIYSFILIL